MGISDNTVNNSIVGDKYVKGTSFFVILRNALPFGLLGTVLLANKGVLPS